MGVEKWIIVRMIHRAQRTSLGGIDHAVPITFPDVACKSAAGSLSRSKPSKISPRADFVSNLHRHLGSPCAVSISSAVFLTSFMKNRPQIAQAIAAGFGRHPGQRLKRTGLVRFRLTRVIIRRGLDISAHRSPCPTTSARSTTVAHFAERHLILITGRVRELQDVDDMPLDIGFTIKFAHLQPQGDCSATACAGCAPWHRRL